MPQTFYIENDEEVISVIGRLRRSSSQENYFVFPKRALVLQSIVNLRLFQREAEKLGKQVVVVTQDEAGKLLAEKAGLPTERYTDDFSRKNNHLELTAAAPVVAPEVPKLRSEQNRLRSQDIGSSDFYAPAESRKPLSEEAPGRALRIRNASPEKQTSLNSKRLVEPVPVKAVESPRMPFHPSVTMPPQASREPLVPQTNQPRMAPPQGNMGIGREERLKNFFTGNRGSDQQNSAPGAKTDGVSGAAVTSVASKKAGSIFLLLGGVSLLSLIGVLIFLFLPKAEIRVTPYKTTQNVDLQFEGREGVSGQDTGSVVSVRVVEREQSVALSGQATGTAQGTAQKARGSILISNRFSSDPQSLVATTRFETPDGKIFRLVSGVTVPGMNGGQPGTVEAAVMADQTGSDYNIAATTFTIPGFKGSAKYEKFSGQSSKAMSGGSNGSGTDQTVISKTDLEKVELEAKEKVRAEYLAAVNGELLPGEKVLEESLDMVSLGNATLPLSGTPASSFEYKNTYRIRGFVFSEEMIKQKITTEGEETVSGILFRPSSVVLTYGEAVPDFEKRTVRLKTYATVTSESVIDREKFLQEILGKDEAAINTLLESYPAIKKIEIAFKPNWFSSEVPTSTSRVTVLVEPGEE